jgi:uncharacterized protein YegL
MVDSSSALVLCKSDDEIVTDEKPLVITLMILDRSGSMQNYGTAPLAGLRALIVGLQEGPEPERIAVGVITFAKNATFDVPIQKVSNINAAGLRYLAYDSTRLYGTVYDALKVLLHIASLRKYRCLETKVNLTVITDGEDTDSQDRLESCRDLASQARSLNWEMAVYGLGVDGIEIARKMGFADPGVTVGPTGQPIGHNLGGSKQDIARSVRHTVTRTHITVMGTSVPTKSGSTPPDSPK